MIRFWRTFDRRWGKQSLILALILLAAWLRLWQLPDVPPGLEYDEAINGLDALWMLKTGTLYLFVDSLHGREVLYLYPSALFIHLLGATPLSLRLTAALAGILTVPLVYRLTLALFRTDRRRYWLAMVAAAGLTTSLWHIGMSRVALRVVLIPPLFIGTALLFWLGWDKSRRQQHTQSIVYFGCAGVALGLSQYAYIAARPFPLVLGVWGVGLWWISRVKSDLKVPWLGFFITGGVGFLVFLPLGLFFFENSASFGRRSGQVAFEIQWTVDGIVTWGRHLGQAITLFLGGSDPRIRHHLIERPVFDWLTLVAFWSGLFVALRQWRRPVFLFLLVSLFLLWLPAPLSVDPIHSPRASGLLPAFFILAAVGLFHLVAWLGDKVSLVTHQTHVGLTSLFIILCGVGGLNTYDYFVRWANHPLVYAEYKGPSLDLAHYAAELTTTTDVIVPYNFYAYAPVRYFLRDRFREALALPFDPAERLDDNRPVVHFNWLQDSSSSALMWLTRDESGQGVAYLTTIPLQNLEMMRDQPILGRRQSLIAISHIMDETKLTGNAIQDDIVRTSYVFDGYISLGGYQIRPALVSPGEAGVITFYWQDLQDADLGYSVFIQILNERGEPVSQLEETVIKEPIHYYENRDGFVSQKHLFWLGSDVSPGLYLLRMGLFEPHSGQRLSITSPKSEVLGDQIVLAPFYVSANGPDPRLPNTPLQASLGEAIDLLGYSLSQPFEELTGSFMVKLYWQANRPINNDYTAFVQLLDAQNQVVSQWDTRPVAGLYPTTRWTQGQIITTEFPLVIDGKLTKQGYRLVTGMYDFTTGQRLPTFDADGQLLPDNMIVLTEITP